MYSAIYYAVGFFDLRAAREISRYGVVVKAGQVGGAASDVDEGAVGELIKVAERAGLVGNRIGECDIAGVGRGELFIAIPIGVVAAGDDGLQRRQGAGVKQIVIGRP